ncbi:ATP-binding protein [Actinoplanes sp. NEAU-A12]|uniref:ATP-binding protein n=1 Tax=Actinoplanes sandaracinus TaxID=3045177 RepID=A0ABT6WKC8_9ACTN|nr:ATP-binding protein [Actinoplanes sandaracinus]MDI6100115.1 ATP-binding protein [Actinoplanes sandaracinus]
MGPGSPHLIGWSDDAVADSVLAVIDADTAVIELTVWGGWDRTLSAQARLVVDKCLAEHPAGLIVDLHHLRDPHAVSAPLWLTACAQAAAMTPPVAIAVCVPAGMPLARRLRRLGARDWLVFYPTVPQAREVLAGRHPLADRMHLALPPDQAAAVQARSLVTDACADWGLDHLAERSRLVISELVVNAAEHAGTDIEVVVSSRGPASGVALHLAVYDGDPVLPRVRDPVAGRFGPSLSERGLGLRIVGAAASSWGALPARGGKLVWAIIRTRPEVSW